MAANPDVLSSVATATASAPPARRRPGRPRVDAVNRAQNDLALIAAVILYERRSPRRRGSTAKAFEDISQRLPLAGKTVQDALYRRTPMRLALETLDDDGLEQLAALYEHPRSKGQ